MKIALCFYGYFGKKNIENNKQQLYGHTLDDYKEIWSINHFKKFIIDGNDIDIFFHCWNEEEYIKELLLEEYKPKDYSFEIQDNIYSKDKHINRRFYSESKSTELMLKYSKDNTIKYDFVMHTLFDQLFFTKIDFNKLDNSFIYNSNWNRARPNIILDNYYYNNSEGLYDQWYICNMENINKITNYENITKMYEKYDHRTYGSHKQRFYLIKQLGLKDKLRFILYVGKEHVKCNQIFCPWYEHCLKYCIN